MARLHEAAAAGNIAKVKEYILAGDDVNDMKESVTSKGEVYSKKHIGTGEFGREMTPLHLAAYNGHTQIVRILIDAGAEIDKRDTWNNKAGTTAFEIAISRRNLGLARVLKEAGAKDEYNALVKALSNRNLRDELFHAALYKKPEVVIDIEASGLLTKELGEQTLVYAAEFNSLTVVDALLKMGVSPDAFHDYETALGKAAKKGNDTVVEFLLKKGAKADLLTSTRWHEGRTPLCWAFLESRDRASNPRLIKLLLDGGAKIENIDDVGFSFIAQHGKPEEVDVLLTKGLDPNTMSNGECLLDRCIKHGNYALAIKLIQSGAKVGFIDILGKNYLHKSNDLELTQLLLAKGLDPELQDHSGKTPIDSVGVKCAEFLAGKGVSIKTLTLNSHVVLSSPLLANQLIKEGLANFSVLDHKNRTPLRQLAQGACLDGYLDTLKCLLDSGIKFDINQAGVEGGWTALHDAFRENRGFVEFYDKKTEDENVAKSKYTKAVDLLISHGAEPLTDHTGRTPLMCMTLSELSRSFNSSVIDRYYRFEADYYGVDPEKYKNELHNLYDCGFQPMEVFYGLHTISVPREDIVKRFWERVDSVKMNSFMELKKEKKEPGKMYYQGNLFKPKEDEKQCSVKPSAIEEAFCLQAGTVLAFNGSVIKLKSDVSPEIITTQLEAVLKKNRVDTHIVDHHPDYKNCLWILWGEEPFNNYVKENSNLTINNLKL